MKKIIEFLNEYGFFIFVAISFLVVLGCFVIPLFVVIAKDFWAVALA